MSEIIDKVVTALIILTLMSVIFNSFINKEEYFKRCPNNITQEIHLK